MIARVATLTLLLALSGCGLQLAERDPLPEDLEQVRIQLPADAREFAPRLRDAFSDRGVEILDRPEQGAVKLVVHRFSEDERVLSVSSGGTPVETELSLTVIFSLLDGDAVLVSDERLVLTRDLTWDVTRVLAKEREQEILGRALQEEAARRIVARYARSGE